MSKSGTEDEERTTAIGLFHYADSYWLAAKALRRCIINATHPDAPISFSYYHAIELYLKSYLRFHALPLVDLKKLGHSADRLSAKAATLGLFLMDEDKEVMKAMTLDNVMQSRYIKTGAFRRPTHEALDRTCKSFRESIYAEMRKKNLPVRSQPGISRAKKR